MEERVMADDYRGEERRRRWPGAWTGDERRRDPLAAFETDQEPDQSPIAVATVDQATRETLAAPR